jgi:hypothetical protein
MRQRRIAPVHPGEVLLEDFLKPMGITHIGWPTLGGAGAADPRSRARAPRHDRRQRDTSRPLLRHWPQFWMNLPTRYDLERAAATGEYSAIQAAA